MFDMPGDEDVMAEFVSMSASPNAYTSPDMTVYHFSCTDNFEDNLRLLLRYVLTPYFTEESVSKEQGIIGQEIGMYLDDPASMLSEDTMKCLYEKHPIRESILGTVQSIGEISPKTLYDCYNAFYTPANMVLAIVGDVNPEEAVKIASEAFEGKENREVPLVDYRGEEPTLPFKKELTRISSVSIPQMLLAIKMDGSGDGRVLQRKCLLCDLAMSLLTSPSSPFYARLYSEGLINSDFSGDCECLRGTFTAFISGETRKPGEVSRLFFEECASAAENGFPAARFSGTKKSFFGSKLRRYDRFGGYASALIGSFFDGDNLYDESDIIESITMEEVCAFIKENFVPEKASLGVNSPD
ncbi:MAG: insulinase family protein [Oscillospiraceae bacterium]|nr:insulinase family protein [Oscillospiraceae bacterium]